jgi:hypothetical protein
MKFSGFFLVTLGLFWLGEVGPAQAEVSFWQKLFGAPSEEGGGGPPPEKTLQAPFGNGKTAAPETDSQKNMMTIYEHNGDDQNSTESLDKAHRSPEQVGEWVAGAVTDALSINPPTWAEDSKKIESSFLPYGFQEYQSYLTRMGLLNSLQSSKMRLQAITDGTPTLLKEAPLDGTYHWVYRIPLLLTYYDQSIKKIEKGQRLSAQSQKVLVEVQVGRVPMDMKNLESEVMGVVIERWSVGPAR